jgi:hypothetical protein
MEELGYTDNSVMRGGTLVSELCPATCEHCPLTFDQADRDCRDEAAAKGYLPSEVGRAPCGHSALGAVCCRSQRVRDNVEQKRCDNDSTALVYW